MVQLSSLSRRGIVGLVSIGAGAALVLGTGVVGASAATPTPKPSASASACTFGQHLRQTWRGIPEQMRTDLKAARAMAAGDTRRAALKKVWDTAKSGGYGPAAQERAAWIAAHRGDAKLRPFPDALKTDLGKLKGESRADRITGLDAIAAKALSGGYGAKLEALAKQVQGSSAWKDCSTGS